MPEVTQGIRTAMMKRYPHKKQPCIRLADTAIDLALVILEGCPEYGESPGKEHWKLWVWGRRGAANSGREETIRQMQSLDRTLENFAMWTRRTGHFRERREGAWI